MALFRKLEQRCQCHWIRADGRIEVERAAFFDDFFGGFPNAHGCMRQRPCGAMDEIRESAAGMGEDDFAVRIGADGVIDDQIHGGAAGLVRIVEHGLRKGLVDEVFVHGVRGMYKNHCLAPAQLGPDGFEVGVTKVMVVGSVTSEKGDSVCAELVEGVSNFFQACFSVEKGGKRGEEAI